MPTYIVTVRLPKGSNGEHNPGNKKTGPCPVSNVCTDVTGEHHSYLEVCESSNRAVSNAHLRGFRHVTRVEQVGE